MFAQITVHCTKDANHALFFAGLGVSNIPGALAKTTFANTPEMGGTAIFGTVGATYVLLIFPVGQNGFEAHVENHVDRASIANLKESAEIVARVLEDAATRCGLRVDDCSIRVIAENNLMLTARKPDRMKYLRELFTEKILGHFIVALITAGIALAAKIEIEKSVVTFFATLIALIARTILEALFFKGGFKYVDA